MPHWTCNADRIVCGAGSQRWVWLLLLSSSVCLSGRRLGNLLVLQVHSGCLRRWQTTVRCDRKGLAKRDGEHAAADLAPTVHPACDQLSPGCAAVRAAKCSVCRTLFTLKPPALPLRQLVAQHLTTAAYVMVAAWLSLCIEGEHGRHALSTAALARAQCHYTMSCKSHQQASAWLTCWTTRIALRALTGTTRVDHAAEHA